MKLRNKFYGLGTSFAVGSAFVATSANAVIDVTAVTTAISDASTAIATVGAAVLVMLVGAKVYKWIRAAL